MGAVGEQLAFEEFPALLDGGRRQVADRCFLEKRRDGRSDRRQLGLL